MAVISAIRNNSLGLAIFAIITAGAIALTQAATKERIDDNRKAAQARALYEIVPRDSLDNDLLHDSVHVAEARKLGFKDGVDAYIARRDGAATTVIVPVVAPDGYSGRIDLIVGIRADGTLAGLRVLRHQETPGLGDKVDLKKSSWVRGFEGQRLDGAEDRSWAVKKDGGRFDQFTGATITPRAVVNAAKRAILFFEANKPALLLPKPSTASGETPSHG